MNGELWKIILVPADSDVLIDRTGKLTVATTDPELRTVYLSKDLRGKFLTKVLIHELGHCAMVSYYLLDDIHRMVKPEYWIEAEELICNIIAEYGMNIFSIAFSKLGFNAWKCIPTEFEKVLRKEGNHSG